MADVTGVLVQLEGPAEPDVVSRLGVNRDLTVERRCADLAELLGAARAGIGRVAVVSLGRGVDRPFLAELARLGVWTVLVAGPEDLHRSGALGADRVVPDGVDVAAGVERAVLELLEELPPHERGSRPVARGRAARPGPAPEPGSGPGGGDGAPGPSEAAAEEAADARRPGRLVAVWSACGSTGRSTVAAALAAEIAVTGMGPVLVDADTVAPGLVQLLGVLEEGAALPALCRAAAAGTLDAETLARRLVRVEPGLELVSGLTRPDRWREVEPDALRVVIEALRARAGLVVADVAGGLEPAASRGADRAGATRTVLAEADDVLVLVPPDPVGVRRAITVLGQDVPGTGRRHVVLAHTRPVPSRDADAARAALDRFAGLDVAAQIPYDAAVPAALLAGRALAVHAPRSPARVAVRELADLALGVGSAPRGGGRGLPRRLTDWVRAPLRPRGDP